MSSPQVYDYAILGGGCSGLSLAVHAALDGTTGSWVVLEPRHTYENDRTFCFWELEDQPFASAVSHRWQRATVRSGERLVSLDWRETPYACVPADRFYREALRILDRSASVQLRRDTRATDVRAHPRGVLIDTDRGPVLARRVFDSRPPADSPGAGTLLQHFGGLHVRTARPIFDTESVTLMEFDTSERGATAFVYVLPFAPDEALVESTVFSARSDSAARHESRVREWLREKLGEDSYEVVRREHGVLPMTTAVVPPSGPATPIGAAAGWLRPSTGYSFATTQRACREAIARLARDAAAPLPRVRPRALGFLDAVLLQFLSQRPEASPGMFLDLFGSVPEARLVRFLSDRPRPLDVLHVVRAMPTLPFLFRVPAATRALLLGRA